jgi:hypothetical protein
MKPNISHMEPNWIMVHWNGLRYSVTKDDDGWAVRYLETGNLSPQRHKNLDQAMQEIQEHQEAS